MTRLCLLPLLLLPGLQGAQPPPKVPVCQEVKAKGLTVPFGAATKPTTIRSAAELEKVLRDKTARDNVLKAVDFTRQELLIFAWRGSGMDRLTYEVAGGKIHFTYTRGRTRDLRSHVKVFAIARGTSWQFGK